MLIDAGFPGARDGERIAAAAKDAGLSQIDYFLNTHFHGDHFGSIPDLVGRIPVRTFVDHGTIGRDRRAIGRGIQDLYGCARQREASRRQGRRQGPDQGPRRTGRDCRRCRPRQAARGRRRGQSALRQCGGDAARSDRRRLVGRQHHQPRIVPHDRPGRSHLEQGKRAGVSGNLVGTGRPLPVDAARAERRRPAGAGPRAAPAGGGHQQCAARKAPPGSTF